MLYYIQLMRDTPEGVPPTHLWSMKGVCLLCLSLSICLSLPSLLLLWSVSVVKLSCAPTASLKLLGSSPLRWKRLSPKRIVSCATARTSLPPVAVRGVCGKTAITAIAFPLARMFSPSGYPRSAAATPAAGRCPIIRNGNISGVIFIGLFGAN